MSRDSKYKAYIPPERKPPCIGLFCVTLLALRAQTNKSGSRDQDQHVGIQKPSHTQREPSRTQREPQRIYIPCCLIFVCVGYPTGTLLLVEYRLKTRPDSNNNFLLTPSTYIEVPGLVNVGDHHVIWFLGVPCTDHLPGWFRCQLVLLTRVRRHHVRVGLLHVLTTDFSLSHSKINMKILININLECFIIISRLFSR